VPVLFHTGGAHGIHPSEVSPPERSCRPFDRKRTHLPFSPRSISAARRRQTGLRGPGYRVHSSRECLAVTRSFNPAAAGASHGVRPSRVCCKSLDPDFSGPPLTRFTGSGDCSPNSPAPQSLDRLSLRSARRRTGVHADRSNPHGVRTPACS